MRYKIREIVNEENWSGDMLKHGHILHGFKNKDELIGWLIDYANWTSKYWKLEMIE